MQLTRRLDANHDMDFGQGIGNFARNAEATAQNVRCRLLFLLGEWFLDTSVGVPWLQRITAKPVDLAYAESVLKATILGTDGVDQLLGFSLQFNRQTREATVVASIATVYNSTLNIQVP